MCDKGVYYLVSRYKLIVKVLPTFTTWGGARRRVRRTRAPWSGTTTKGCRDVTRARTRAQEGERTCREARETRAARYAREAAMRGDGGAAPALRTQGKKERAARPPVLTWSQGLVSRPFTGLLLYSTSSLSSRVRVSSQFKHVAFLEAVVYRCRIWFCRLPLLGAVSGQLPNSVEVGCCI